MRTSTRASTGCAAALSGLAAHPLDQLCDELLATMRPLVPDDDVALIAVRSRDPGP